MGRMIESQREEVIRRILKLREFDEHGIQMSWAVVAAKLNDEGVSTFSGEGKWDAGTMRRIIAGYTHKKAETKTGVKPVEVLMIEEGKWKSEIDSQAIRIRELEAEQQTMLDVISGLRKANQAHRDEKEGLQTRISGLEIELDTIRHSEELESVKAEYAILKESNVNANSVLDKVRQSESEKQAEIELLRIELDKVRQSGTDIRRRNEILSGKVESLQKTLAETEFRYRDEYESRITELGNKLAESKAECERLHGQKLFEIEKSGQTNFEGWTIQKRSGGTGYNVCRKIGGKLIFVYIGKDKTVLSVRPDLIREKIARKLESLKASAVKEADPQPTLFVQPAAQSFEERLRTVCGDERRTYRLDTVRKLMRSPDLGRLEFDRGMLDLASKQIIELVGGDPRQCDIADLLRDSETGTLYVNFEWR